MVFMVTKRDKWQWAAVLIAACILTYANGLGGGFTYDDKAIVRDNPRIRSPGNVPQIFATSYFGGPRGAGTGYRPVLLLSYAVQWWIHGRQAVAFHAVNVLLHAGATLLLAALFLRIAIPPAAALAGTLLFAVAPIHVEAVTSLVGRGEVLAAVFTLLYLHLALRHFGHLSPPGLAASDALAAPCHPFASLRAGSEERSDEGSASAPSNRSKSFASLRMTRRFPLPLSRLAVLLAALLCYALAVLTKESGSSAPALALLLFVFVEEGGLRERLGRAFVRGLPVLRGALSPLLPLASGSGIPLLLLGVPAGVQPSFPDRNDLRRAARVSAERGPMSSGRGAHCGECGEPKCQRGALRSPEPPGCAHAAAFAAPGGGCPSSGRANNRAQFCLVERRGSVLESRPDSAREREGSLRHRLYLGG